MKDKIKISIKPLDIQDAFDSIGYKAPNYKRYKRDLMSLLPQLIIDPYKALKIEITFGFSNVNSDMEYPVKTFLYCLQKKYGFTYNIIYELLSKKVIVLKGKEFIEFQITKYV